VFDAQTQDQLQALTLVNGTVYVTYSSHCDGGRITAGSWIRCATLEQRAVYSDTPRLRGGLWESAWACADAQGSFSCDGERTVGDAGPDEPDEIVAQRFKLTPSGSTLQVSSYFTPRRLPGGQRRRSGLRTMGSLLIPNSSYFFTAARRDPVSPETGRMGGCPRPIRCNKYPAPVPAPTCIARRRTTKAARRNSCMCPRTTCAGIPFDRGSNLPGRSREIHFTPADDGQSGAVLSVSSNGATAGTLFSGPATRPR